MVSDIQIHTAPGARTRQNKNRLGYVKSTETNIKTIPPNSLFEIKGYVNKEIPYKNTTTMLVSSDIANNNQDLNIEPSLIQYHHKRNGILTVQVSNITNRTYVFNVEKLVIKMVAISTNARFATGRRKQCLNISTGTEYWKFFQPTKKLTINIYN